MRKTLLCLSCGLALLTTGCLHPKVGPQSLPRDRALYSVSLADSWKEQTLLNIIKVRYSDPPVFVDIGNIISSYTLAQGTSVGGTIIPNGNSQALVGGSVTFSNSPTITYTPLTGNAYIKGLITSLPAPMVFAGIQNGLPADSTLLSSISSINGLSVRELMREIQISGAIRLYVKDDGKRQTSILGLRTSDVPPEIQAASKELRALLRLNPDATEFTLVSAPLPSSDTEVAVMTRSISGMIQNMAAQVEVPPEHVSQHRAFPGVEAGHELPGIVPMMRIHSSKNKPGDSFVNVYYRDTWFWIDDGDLASKTSMVQLMQLFTMMDTGPRENLPVVTIPSR
jgi:hypothetical protein